MSNITSREEGTNSLLIYYRINTPCRSVYSRVPTDVSSLPDRPPGLYYGDARFSSQSGNWLPWHVKVLSFPSHTRYVQKHIIFYFSVARLHVSTLA
jgi:hypothetical protein